MAAGFPSKVSEKYDGSFFGYPKQDLFFGVFTNSSG